MRAWTLAISAAIGSFGVSILMQKGQLDWFPNWLAYCAVAAPPVTWIILGLTHAGFKGYVRQTNRRMGLIVFIATGVLIGGLLGWGFYELQSRSVRISSRATHVNTFTPREIAIEIGKAGPLQREDIANAFVDGTVDWSLPFLSVEPVKGVPSRIKITFAAYTYHGPFVVCEADRQGNEYLGTLKDLPMFNVKGVIQEVEPTPASQIQLRDVSFRQLSTRSEHLTTAQREQFVAMLRRASGQRVCLVCLSKTDEALDFAKQVNAALQESGITVVTENYEGSCGFGSIRIVKPWANATAFVANLPDMLDKAFQKIGISPEMALDEDVVHRTMRIGKIPSPHDVTIFVCDKP